MPLRAALKRFALSLAYPGWRHKEGPGDAGYTFVIPAPMDMPYLCYLALAGLRNVDLLNCREILVVPDGWGTDTRGLADAIAAASLKTNVRLLSVSARQRTVRQFFGHRGIAHWTQIVESIDAANTDLIFLHDADAFFRDGKLLEASYELCRSQHLQSLGVTARWDPAFTRVGIEVPGTWELMFSANWARTWRPVDHKAGKRATNLGRVFFDTMLYPQYKDYGAGRIKVQKSDSFLHLSGTIVTYRAFVDRGGRRVGDELFRLLFLSLMKELCPPFREECMLPRVAELAGGLRDPNPRVHYRFPGATGKYAEFRAFMAKLMDAPVFAANRSAMAAMIKPFDEHFSALRPDAPGVGAQEYGRLREHGLWVG